MTLDRSLSRTLHRRSFLAAGAAAGAVALSGCGAGSSGSGKDFRGTLSFLNYTDWIGPHTVQRFEAKHPGVKIRQVTNGATLDSVLPKLKAQPGLYDLSLASLDGVERAVKVGLLEPLDFSSMPNVKRVEKAYLDTPVSSGKDTYLVPTDVGKVGIGVRRDLISEDITSWSDLWSVASKYSGKLYLYDYMRDLMGTALLYLGHQPNDTDSSHIAAAGKALEVLKPSIGTLGTDGIGAALVKGDAAIAVTYDYEVYSAASQNKDIAWIAPTEGMTGYLEGLVACKGTKSLTMVEEFIDFHMAPANYAAFVKRNDIAFVETGMSSLLPSGLVESEILFPPASVVDTVTFERYLGSAETSYDKAYAAFKAA